MINQLHLKSRIASQPSYLPLFGHIQQVLLDVREYVHHVAEDSGV